MIRVYFIGGGVVDSGGIYFADYREYREPTPGTGEGERRLTVPNEFRFSKSYPRLMVF